MKSVRIRALSILLLSYFLDTPDLYCWSQVPWNTSIPGFWGEIQCHSQERQLAFRLEMTQELHTSLLLTFHCPIRPCGFTLPAEEVGKLVPECICVQEGVNEFGGGAMKFGGDNRFRGIQLIIHIFWGEPKLPFKIIFLIRNGIFSWLLKAATARKV